MCMNNAIRTSVFCILLATSSIIGSSSFAQEARKGSKIELAAGKLVLAPPADWKAVPPRSPIIEYEFMAPKDEPNAEKQVRITLMQATGGIDANVQRWYDQFQQPDGSSTKEKSKLEEFKAVGQKIHFLDIPGTYKDSMGGGPFAPKATVMRENYRMLGAIIQTEKMGDFFLKVTGPKDSVEKQRSGIRKMLEGLEVKK